MFPKYKQRYYLHLYARVVAHTSNRFEFILTRKNHIDCCQERPGGLLSVSISFTVGASRSSESLLSTVRAFFLPPRFTLDSHSIRPSRSVVTARRLYKFYIIFMRHKVVEKPAEERREKKRVRERRRGSFSIQIIPLGPLPPPPVGAIVTWLGGAVCIPSCSLVGVGYEREGKADDRRRGCSAALGVMVVNCSPPDELYIEKRFMSCLVKKFAIANTFFLSS